MKTVWDDTKLQERITRAAMRGIVAATELVRREAISLVLNSTKSGRIYQHGSVVHRASAPGEAPASDTGRLVNSIITKYDDVKLTGTVETTVAYGPYLEFGTEKMEPRPFLRPALANRKADVLRLVRDEIARELTR